MFSEDDLLSIYLVAILVLVLGIINKTENSFLGSIFWHFWPLVIGLIIFKPNFKTRANWFEFLGSAFFLYLFATLLGVFDWSFIK